MHLLGIFHLCCWPNHARKHRLLYTFCKQCASLCQWVANRWPNTMLLWWHASTPGIVLGPYLDSHPFYSLWNYKLLAVHIYRTLYSVNNCVNRFSLEAFNLCHQGGASTTWARWAWRATAPRASWWQSSTPTWTSALRTSCCSSWWGSSSSTNPQVFKGNSLTGGMYVIFILSFNSVIL